MLLLAIHRVVLPILLQLLHPLLHQSQLQRLLQPQLQPQLQSQLQLQLQRLLLQVCTVIQLPSCESNIHFSAYPKVPFYWRSVFNYRYSVWRCLYCYLGSSARPSGPWTIVDLYIRFWKRAVLYCKSVLYGMKLTATGVLKTPQCEAHLV